MHASKRCSMCSIAWPPTIDFNTCPSCMGQTWGSNSDPDYSLDEALSEKKHYDFGHYLERRVSEDRKLLESVKPAAFADYLIDAAEEQIARIGFKAEDVPKP